MTTISDEFRARLAAREPRQERMSFSLPAELVRWVREVAAETGVPISRVVVVCIEDYRASEEMK
jgi:hypothetical protein